MIEFILIFLLGCLTGGAIVWVLMVPTKEKNWKDIVIDRLIPDNSKVDEKEWKKCMKECDAYYQDNGKIWDNETAVVDVKKSKKKKNDSRRKRTKANNSKTKR